MGHKIVFKIEALINDRTSLSNLVGMGSNSWEEKKIMKLTWQDQSESFKSSCT